MYFYKPNYLQTDFESALETLGQSFTLNYDEATPTTFLGLINDMDFKANIKGLLDQTRELAVSLDLSIQKGDYLTDSESNIFLVNWQVYKDVNCKRVQLQVCNYQFEFERWQPKQIDSDGVTSTPASYITIASVYGYLSRNGQGSFDSREGQVGVTGSQRVIIGIKYNDDTSELNIHDEFNYFNYRYEITDIDYTQMNSDGTSGIIFIYGQVKSGGENAIT